MPAEAKSHRQSGAATVLSAVDHASCAPEAERRGTRSRGKEELSRQGHGGVLREGGSSHMAGGDRWSIGGVSCTG